MLTPQEMRRVFTFVHYHNKNRSLFQKKFSEKLDIRLFLVRFDVDGFIQDLDMLWNDKKIYVEYDPDDTHVDLIRVSFKYSYDLLMIKLKFL